MSQIISENVVVAIDNFPAVCDSTFEISNDNNFFVLVTGPNGSGKTTLLKAMAGITPVIRGKLSVNNIDVSSNSTDIKRTCTYVGHNFNFLEYIKVKEHIELNMTLNKIAKKNDSAKNEYDLLDLNQVLDFCKLSNRKNVYVSDLSAGQKRRLQLGCAFMRSVDVVLIDEPHSSLDSESKDIFDGLFESQFKSGRSLVIATHDPHRLKYIATNALNVDNGIVSKFEMKNYD